MAAEAGRVVAPDDEAGHRMPDDEAGPKTPPARASNNSKSPKRIAGAPPEELRPPKRACTMEELEARVGKLEARLVSQEALTAHHINNSLKTIRQVLPRVVSLLGRAAGELAEHDQLSVVKTKMLENPP